MSRMRRLAAVLADVARTPSCPAELAGDAAWFDASARTYEIEGPGGMDLATAFGLKLKPGESPWWEIERRERRDRVVRQVRAEFFADLSVADAARAIIRENARAARQSRPTGAALLLTEAGRLASVPRSIKRVREILDAK